MKYQIPFTAVSDFIKRITSSWTATKTTDDTVKVQATEHDVDHIILPSVQTDHNVIPVSSHTYTTSENDYHSTY